MLLKLYTELTLRNEKFQTSWDNCWLNPSPSWWSLITIVLSLDYCSLITEMSWSWKCLSCSNRWHVQHSIFCLRHRSSQFLQSQFSGLILGNEQSKVTTWESQDHSNPRAPQTWWFPETKLLNAVLEWSHIPRWLGICKRQVHHGVTPKDNVSPLLYSSGAQCIW